MTLPRPRKCRECSKPLPAKAKASITFCDGKCRIAWRNRRMSRGADLYDCFMAMRYDREEAKAEGLWALMCRMAQTWNEEDVAAGRKSYFQPKETSMRNIHHRATVIIKSRKR